MIYKLGIRYRFWDRSRRHILPRFVYVLLLTNYLNLRNLYIIGAEVFVAINICLQKGQFCKKWLSESDTVLSVRRCTFEQFSDIFLQRALLRTETVLYHALLHVWSSLQRRNFFEDNGGTLQPKHSKWP